ncbi:MAG: acyltransferase family protein [Actinomycetota bacterium]
MLTATSPPAQRLPAQAPPQHRDRFIDVLRVGAITGVVAQHWLMAAVSYDGEVLTTANAFDTAGAAAVTWVSQLMPLVFFCGGAAAAYDLRRRGGAPHPAAHHGWLANRLRRLALPVVPLLAVWVPLPHLLLAAGVPAGPVDTASHLAGELLWFLALYVLVTALTPALVRLHRRWRGLEIVALACGAVAVDVLRFAVLGGVDAVGYANVVFVWVAAYLAGVAYAAGSLRWVRGAGALAVAGAGLAGTALAVAAGPYPSSMIGMPGAPMSNMNPPTAVLLAIALLQLGLALALRPVIQRWTARSPVRSTIDWLSVRLMTIYLWHIPALIAVTGVTVVGLGWSTPDLLSAEWRREMPIWIAAVTFTLLGLIRLFDRFERRPRSGRAPAAGRVYAATVPIGFGLLALTVNGFAPGLAADATGPVAAGIAIVLGLGLLNLAAPAVRPSEHERVGT